MRLRIWIIYCIFHFSAVGYGQTIAGTWQTLDDETGQSKSHVQITESNGTLNATIVKLLIKPADSRCEKCPGERYNQPVIGMTILDQMKFRDGFYQDGKILDPEKGKWYSCKVWLKEGDPNTLVVRGSIGPFYRTQYWKRI